MAYVKHARTLNFNVYIRILKLFICARVPSQDLQVAEASLLLHGLVQGLRFRVLKFAGLRLSKSHARQTRPRSSSLVHRRGPPPVARRDEPN